MRQGSLQNICSRYLSKALLLATLTATLAFTQRSPAGFTRDEGRMHVEIDGVDFGAFDPIANIDVLAAASSVSALGDDGQTRITLKRDFVTDKSLYLWASKTMQHHSGQRDVQLVMRDDHGDETARYVLRSCQPMSWSVEAANPAIGGYHETVELAVQDVTEF